MNWLYINQLGDILLTLMALPENRIRGDLKQFPHFHVPSHSTSLVKDQRFH